MWGDKDVRGRTLLLKREVGVQMGIEDLKIFR